MSHKIDTLLNKAEGKVPVKWKSVAKWPYPQVNLGTDGNLSMDTHHSKEAALAVTRALEKDGFGGDGDIFPLKTYVVEVKNG